AFRATFGMPFAARPLMMAGVAGTGLSTVIGVNGSSFAPSGAPCDSSASECTLSSNGLAATMRDVGDRRLAADGVDAPLAVVIRPRQTATALATAIRRVLTRMVGPGLDGCGAAWRGSWLIGSRTDSGMSQLSHLGRLLPDQRLLCR